MIALAAFAITLIFIIFPDSLELAMSLSLLVTGIILLTKKVYWQGGILAFIGLFFYVVLSGQETVDLANKTTQSASQGDPITLILLALLLLGGGVLIGRATKKT